MTIHDNTNDTYTFRIVNDPSNMVFAVSTAEENGVQIEHSDYFYKNEISVTVDGQTHTMTTPNCSFILASVILLILLITLIAKKVKQFIEFRNIQDKYSLVTEEFIRKTKFEQLIENNQEIHALNVRLENYEDNIHNLKGKVDKILQKLDDKIGELEK